MSDELERIRRGHYPGADATTDGCCGQPSPCDAARLLEMLDEANTEAKILIAYEAKRNEKLRGLLTRALDTGLSRKFSLCAEIEEALK